MRDPKKSPAAGDVVTKFGTRRTVESVELNSNSTITHVSYNGQRCSIGA